MAGSQAIHQIEYRWQQARDMAAVASSLPPADYQSWVSRIGAWVRHPGVDVPSGSVRYERFDENSAALAWRQRGRQAVGFEGGRPLVSRVLVGPARLLDPEAAMAVCYAGLPGEMIGPRPGAVEPGDSLPLVDPGWLTRLVRDHKEALDRAAAWETGLDRVAAAALGDLGTPLSVELPEDCINRTPWRGSQAVLLWGLWTTISPLLGPGVQRGWSFSTFELPLGDMDPATLPDIVFRSARSAPPGPPMTPRTETRVRPQEPAAMPVETLPQHLARLLVIAYQDRGGEEFTQLITSYADGYQSTGQRIQAVYTALEAKLSPLTVVTERPEKVTNMRPAGYVAAQAPGAREVADQESARSGRVVPSAVMQPAPPIQPAPPMPIQPPLPSVSPPAAEPAASSTRSPRDAPRLYPDAGQPRPGEKPRQSATLSALFARLSAGPATEEFDSALRALRSSNFPDADPPERAAARKLIARHRWYLDVVRQYGQAEREAILVVIFMCSVIPDLADEQVLAEIAHWAGPLAAPDPVINALYQATDGMVGAQLLMSQALEPVLAQRWRLEHHVHVPAAIPSPVQDAPPGLRDQGTGPQRAAASQGAPPPAGPQPPPATVPPAGAQAAMSQAPVRPPINAQWLLGQLEGNWSVPRALVLAACIAFIVLIVLR